MNDKDIVGFSHCPPISLGKFNRLRASLLKKHWHVTPIIDVVAEPCPVCGHRSMVWVAFSNDDRDERSFDVCFHCGTATEDIPIYEGDEETSP